MNTHEIIYLTIFLLVIVAGSFGSGYYIRKAWFKCLALFERTKKWQQNGGKW